MVEHAAQRRVLASWHYLHSQSLADIREMSVPPEDAARIETPHFKYPRFLFTPTCYRFEENNLGVGQYVVARIVPVNDTAT